MNADITANELDRSLVAIWQPLYDARNSSARFVEGLIAELRDDASDPEQRIESVGRAWWGFVRSGRGIPEFYVSSGSKENDREANIDFRRNVERVSQLLERYDPTFGRPSVPYD